MDAPPPPPAAGLPVTSADFQAYVLFRVLDSIAYPGTYKKFMLARKEQDAPWAVRMAQQVQAVQAAIQDLELKEQDLRSSPLAALHIVSHHVTESNLPPSDLQLTIGNCAISRKTAIPCVIVRGKGRGAQPFTVNSRFSQFLYNMWVINKLDILIKTFARQCLDALDPRAQLPMGDIVSAFQTRYAEDVAHLAEGFFLAYAHVLRSIRNALETII